MHSGQSSSWSHFDHDADIGVCGQGPTLEDAFEQAAQALTAVVTERLVRPKSTVEIVAEAPDPETLFVDWLNALVFEMATRDMLFSQFDVNIDQSAGWRLRATVRGEAIDRARHSPAVEIKGATYTELWVGRIRGLWRARCILDV